MEDMKLVNISGPEHGNSERTKACFFISHQFTIHFKNFVPLSCYMNCVNGKYQDIFCQKMGLYL